MKLIFFNIGWMHKYNGIAGDSIERGGKHNKHSIGLEVCNFTNNRGTLYGYVHVGGVIKIEKLGASTHDDQIDGVTVVWTAVPRSGGTVVVGWYREATVYRNLQKIENPNELQKENSVTSFRVSASAEKATLLPVEQRELIIPRAVKGFIGKSNVWYAQSEESRRIVEEVTALINSGSFTPLPDFDQSKSIKEGNPKLALHLRRERNAAIVKRKKAAVLEATGKLCCEVCGFDFQEFYGGIGEGFCEVHHLLPLSKSDGITTTELKDLAVICSNCHRIIHRTDPMLSIDKLTQQLNRSRG